VRTAGSEIVIKCVPLHDAVVGAGFKLDSLVLRVMDDAVLDGHCIGVVWRVAATNVDPLAIAAGAVASSVVDGHAVEEDVRGVSPNGNPLLPDIMNGNISHGDVIGRRARACVVVDVESLVVVRDDETAEIDVGRAGNFHPSRAESRSAKDGRMAGIGADDCVRSWCSCRAVDSERFVVSSILYVERVATCDLAYAVLNCAPRMRFRTK
jgi:hypothetical protein